MKTSDDYNNLIRLLSDILKFYANKDNYDIGLIKADGGFQAKFALDKIEGFNEMEENMLDGLTEYLELGMDDNVYSQEEIFEFIQQLKNLKRL